MAVTIQTTTSSITDSAGNGVTGQLRIRSIEEFEYDNGAAVVKVGTSEALYGFTDGLLDATFDLIPNHGTGVDKWDSDADTGPVYRVDFEINDGESWTEFWIIRVAQDNTSIEITDVELSAGVSAVAGTDCDAQDLIDQHVAESDPHPQYLLEDEVSVVPANNLVPRADGTGEIDANWVPDATTISKGKVQLSGDLTGTAAAPTVAAGAIDDAKTNFEDLEVGNSITVGDDAKAANARLELRTGSGEQNRIDMFQNGDFVGTLATGATQDLVLVNQQMLTSGVELRFDQSDGSVRLQGQTANVDDDMVFRIIGRGTDGKPILQLRTDNGTTDTNHLQLFWDDVTNRAEIRNPQSGVQIRLGDGNTTTADGFQVFFDNDGDKIRTPLWEEEFTGTQANVNESITGQWDFDNTTDFDALVNLNAGVELDGSMDVTGDIDIEAGGALTKLGLDVPAFQFHRDSPLLPSGAGTLPPTALNISNGNVFVLGDFTFPSAGNVIFEAYATIRARRTDETAANTVVSTVKLFLWDVAAGQTLGDLTTNSGLTQPEAVGYSQFVVTAHGGSPSDAGSGGPCIAGSTVYISARMENNSPPKQVQVRVQELSTPLGGQITEVRDFRWRAWRETV